jgi:hypothetical protein
MTFQEIADATGESINTIAVVDPFTGRFLELVDCKL